MVMASSLNTIGSRMAELGYATRIPPQIGSLPAGMGKFAVPHYQTFASVWNLASRSWPQAFDEALADSRTNALAIRRDYVIDGAMRKLLMPIASLDWQITPDNPDDPQAQADRDKVTNVIRKTPRPGFVQLVRMLGESRFYGRYGVQCNYKWGWNYTERCMGIDQFAPVNGDKLVFRYTGQPGILVNAQEFKGEWVATDRGSCHFLDESEREQLVWAEYQPEDADWQEAKFGGQVHGNGFRGKLYWPWWLREQIIQQTLRFLRRAANGYTSAYYDAANAVSEARLAAKLRAYTGDDFLLFPRDRHEHTPYGVEHQAIPLHGSSIFLDLVKWINDILSDYILGEDLTTNALPSGFGSETAQAHERTADIRTKYHAADIAVAIQDLVDVLYRYNCNNRPAGRFEFLAEKRDPVEYMEALDFAYNHGLAVAEDDVRDVLGVAAPRQGQSVLAAMVPGQPAGVGGTAQGMPQSMPAGPSPNGQAQYGRRGVPRLYHPASGWASPRRARARYDHFIRDGQLYYGRV